MLQEVTNLSLGFESSGEILTEAIANITAGRVETSPFYWSDMLPVGSVYTQNIYTVTLISTNVFDTVQVYNYTSANYFGLLVYKNNELLTRGPDYVVATDGPRITILTALAVGDKITIQEFTTTYGNFVPNTPTKLGLYPAHEPKIAEIATTTGTATIIIGHDGSQTPAFGDIRDSVLLEFETRIYNNLKLDGNPVPLIMDDVQPGQFRETGYSYSEINDILSVDFLSYVGWNKLDYVAQNFISSNPFSWNYSQSQNKLDNQNLLGAWRGINRYFYDTENPAETPWEMLGLTIKPTWWNSVYGPGPYTSDNLVLWDDLEAGIVADPTGSYIIPKYVRPGLSEVIPVDTEGKLLAPYNFAVGTFDEQQFERSWQIGDGGPVEASWWNSSAYPFAVMRVLALTRPAKFYSLFADRDLYRYSEEFNQYLYNERYRLDANGIQVYGDGTSKASFIDWIVDYNQQTGRNSTAALQADLENLDVRLCYRMASFSDKQYIKLYTEKSSPNSLNTTLLIPDESYDLLLYKNQPFDRLVYSSVVVQLVEGGYAVYGYSTAQPYFDILVSQGVGRLRTFTVGDVGIKVPTQYTTTVSQVPYGFVFTNQTSVADFLLSYGKLLEDQGLTFTDRANGYTLDWGQMVQEFLYWSQQGWEVNSLINLNPLANKLTITKPGAVVDSIVTQTSENVLLNQNKRELPIRNLNVVRLDNTLSMEPLADESLSFADLRFTNFEHMIVLNNKSVFGDLIYEPVTGARQSRLNLIGVTSSDWNGTVDAQGFILNQDNVEEWTGLKKYTKGQVVKYKDEYWSAATIIDPSPLFNFNDWIKSDYEQIEQGLLPNIANKANQLQNSYNVNSANLENDNDLLSYGLIGFRPRQYMAALNLDDVSQVNVYQQFLKTKGTILSAELLSNANLGKESADYQIYENWAIQRAVYGANANRSFVELRLNRALLNSNPSLVQVILPQQVSQADQTIILSDVWRQSYKLTSPDFLPTTFETITDTALPSAGYVNLDDVDITTFTLSDPASIDANLSNVEVGATIWVAKVNDYEWNIYRCVQVSGYIDHVCDNLDGTSIVSFTKPHGLTVGDQLIIRFFDDRIDGVYQVLSTPDINVVTIAYTFFGGQTVINGVGIGFTLQSQRVAQPSDIINLPYANDIQTGAKVWVDNNGAGLWEVLQKENQFSNIAELAPVLLDASEQYGQSVTQAKNRIAALVGSPRYGFGDSSLSDTKGAVYVYVKNYSDQYSPVSPLESKDAILTLDVDGARGYGNAVDFGNQTWAVAGASQSLGPAGEPSVGYAAIIYRDPLLGEPGTNPFVQSQLIVSPDSTSPGEFGYSVVMSQDERWVYVGAPGVNKVYAYGYVDWQDQFVKYLGDDSTSVYTFDSTIQITESTQLVVTLDGTVQLLGIDYQVNDLVEVEFLIAPPAAGVVVEIQRLAYKNLDAGTYYDVTQTSTTGSGVGAQFTIQYIRGQVGQIPGAPTIKGSVGITSPGTGYSAGDTIRFAPAKFGGPGTSPTNDVVLTVTAVTAVTGALEAYTIAYTAPALTNTFSLNEYFFTATNAYSFSVYVDEVLQRSGIDYDFDADSSTVVDLDLTFINIPPAGSNIVVRARGYFEYVDTLTIAGLAANARFGHSVTTTTDGRQVIVGTPDITVDSNIEAGSVYVFDRNVQRFIYDSDNSTIAGFQFTVQGTVTAPVTVIVNNQRLLNETDSILNGPNTFAVSGNIITINGNIQTGDVVEIETNQFELMQQVIQQTLNSSNVTVDNSMEFTNFGQALDVCSYNCSLYIGAPQDSTATWKAGSVQRNVNQSRVYGVTTATLAPTSLTPGNTLRVNNIDVEVPAAPNNTVTGLKNAINALVNLGGVPNVIASVSTTGYLTISVKNSAAAAPGNKLQVAPGSVGTTFTDLGFTTFAYTQSIYSPYPTEFAQFGYSVNIEDSAINLVVGSPQGTLWLFVIFDDGNADWDGNSTTFFSTVNQSGSVYTYDYLPSASDNVTNPGKFVFGLQISDSNVNSYDRFGTAVSYVDGVLMTGAPGNDATYQDGSSWDYGRVFVFENPTRAPAWTVIHEQQPVVDVRLINGVFTYDRITSARTEQFDFFDPLQGKILGAARQNINYIGAVDPAQYNTGPTNNIGTTWGSEHVGEIWWDISTVRFIDPNQDDIVYAARRWGQLFPGSTVDVYQWIQSSVPPSTYTGPGTPLNVFSYTVNARLSSDNVFNTYYYFWVRDIATVATQQGKTLSAITVSRYIENPKSSGIPYVAGINASTIALYNAVDTIEAEDTIINIEFDREYTNNNVHVEYELIPQDKADGFLSTGLYRKLQDSFCGVDTSGNLVPDFNLNAAERYGVQFRPRQSMFVDRFEALKNYLQRANTVLSRYTITESRSFVLLNSKDPEPAPTSGSTVNWNLRVANLEILSYQDIYAVPVKTPTTQGYRYLVASDSSNNGLWTIYEVQTSQFDSSVRVLVLVQVQNYDTQKYWNYINWYLPGYNSSIKVVAEVPTYSALATLNLPVGSSVRVTANAQGKFEIYLLGDIGWDRVGLEDGTIEFSAELWDYALGRFGFDVEVFDAQYFDQEPVIETRKIIQAINEELFIDELAVERNRSLVLMFNFILSEFSAPEWLVKTSLIDVDHKIRNLEPFQNYRQDNQEFVLDYIQEVKPYHVQIREFNLLYNGQDEYFGDVTDFDVPAYYNTSLPIPQYTSPILNISDTTDPRYQSPYLHSTPEPDNVLSDADPGALVWQAWPYTQWYGNYLLELQLITVTASGAGYTDAPSVVITGDAVVPATAVAFLNSFGGVAYITITDPGSGYFATPVITFDGGNGTGARAYPTMGNELVRSFRTVIKYDRCQYQTQVETWTDTGVYEYGTLVRYDDVVWESTQTVTAGSFIIGRLYTILTLGTTNFTLIGAASNTVGVTFVATGIGTGTGTATTYNNGPDFLLENWTRVPAGQLSGIDRTMGYYVPGVNEPGLDLPLLIDGTDYPGVQVFGKDYVSTNTIDATYASSFTDLYLGTRYTDINVDGGKYIGPYEGHAPEELVNGSEFDTVDIRVYTRPGSDWSLYDGVPGEDGHGFQIASRRYPVTNASNTVLDFSGIEENPVYLEVSNITTGVDLALNINYTINWVNKTVTMINSISNGDVLNISAYELGGGSQLYRENYIGDDTDFVIIPVNVDEIYNIVLFVNGELTAVDSWEAYYPGIVWNQLVAYNRLDVVYTTSPTTYYRALQTVPAGIDITNADYWFEFVPATTSKVLLAQTYTSADYLALTALGFTSPVQYSWSTPQTENFVVDAAINATRTVVLSNYLGGTNPANIIVEIDGQRLRPYEGTEWTGDGSTDAFGLPLRGGYSQEIIDAQTDVSVWVNNVLQIQDIGFGGDYTVTPWTGIVGSERQVVFATPPALADRILVSVSTVAAYLVSGNQLQLINSPAIGSILSVTTWNDTSQQNILTLVFQGPVNTGITITESYDSTSFDAGSVTGDPGSYDYSAGSTIPNNDINLQRIGVQAGRLWVTLNGYRLFDGIDYTVQGQYLILASGPMASSDIMVVTEFTESVVPEAIAFRIFQDMRGVQATYRITPTTTTFLTTNLSASDDIAYVNNASALTQPNLPDGVFGICTINGERIMYRNRDTALNTISGLMRGTAGTAATSHTADAIVYDMGRGNLMYEEYQDRIVKDTTLADGSTTIFYAPNIDAVPNNAGDSSTVYIDHSIEVYVGGIRQYPITEMDTPSEFRYTVNILEPLSIAFITDSDPTSPLLPPPDGVDVTIAQRISKVWYGAGINSSVATITIGATYFIAVLGDTDWVAIGVDASDIRVGIEFTATAVGTGTGQVSTVSNGQALQTTDTQAARFLRGL